MANSHWSKRFILWLENLDKGMLSLKAIIQEYAVFSEMNSPIPID
jgi:hypothetical protein